MKHQLFSLFNFIVFICANAALLSNNAAFALNEHSNRRTPVVVAVEKTSAAVANISTERFIKQRYGDPFFGFRSELFEQFFNDYFNKSQRKVVEKPLGSGVIIDEDGYIVTNEHVVSRASKLNVRLADGKNYEATMISSDPVTDLAVLKIESESPLPYVKMGTSKDLMIGETVIALGNPFGLENSVTIGVLSAKNRTFTFSGEYGNLEYNGLIQTDALINPGNSGGPLINIDGELIGINTAIVNHAQGIGFAIPVDKVRETLVKLFNFREINKIWFGAQVEEQGYVSNGILVTSVEKESPAHKAKIKTGDCIIKIDSKRIFDVLDFEKYILKKDAGDKLIITINRNGQEMELSVSLEKAPMPSAEKLALEKLGLYVQDLTPQLAQQLNLWWVKGGVLISEVQKKSPAENVGIKAGHVLVYVGQYRVNNIEEFGALLNLMKKGELWDVGIVWSDIYGEHQGYTRLKVR
ncbi:putative serine proteinase DegP [Candidatus Kuenenia stuttgartiensis]|uniref:Putative serine proteinase DegP n=1 Tax=Kuenenia stuttgartiensis TaxID=174633 RepID=Q1Q2S7_KUEST|nr:MULTISPECIES: trypsin-like peptidase domain-containing protein [Kuenenia]MBE7548895.1 trypsin-like peptidase domain-containing protein [Planctomycetia bacterium]MBZ0192974.1 trypsin-like peptidase domain-containing protein [Candidatus Kuenenia stuttgartiensis]MCF6152664.1 PDZ domain-containing protein [Candidatus Kuenenia stuttgartiensis]MCL4726102.1 trypsin-like peptidase domain-containing protein [Candidatus Kuenenia stuttgartiensis]MCZ7622414.1 trypsin-like peptidase domain-containing pr